MQRKKHCQVNERIKARINQGNAEEKKVMQHGIKMETDEIIKQNEIINE